MSISIQRKVDHYRVVLFDEPVATGQEIVISHQQPELPP